MPGANQHLLCVNNNEWIYLTAAGNIFGTLHQLLILMQINITQYVLVRIPRNLGIFQGPSLSHKMESEMRAKLLNTAEGMDVNKQSQVSTWNEEGIEKKLSLGQILQRIKDAQRKQNATDDYMKV